MKNWLVNCIIAIFSSKFVKSCFNLYSFKRHCRSSNAYAIWCQYSGDCQFKDVLILFDYI